MANCIFEYLFLSSISFMNFVHSNAKWREKKNIQLSNLPNPIRGRILLWVVFLWVCYYLNIEWKGWRKNIKKLSDSMVRNSDVFTGSVQWFFNTNITFPQCYPFSAWWHEREMKQDGEADEDERKLFYLLISWASDEPKLILNKFSLSFFSLSFIVCFRIYLQAAKRGVEKKLVT